MRALAQAGQGRSEHFVTALFELVSDPTPGPTAGKGTVDEDKGLSRRLRAGAAEHGAGARCRHERASRCRAAKHTAARTLKLGHGVSPLSRPSKTVTLDAAALW